MKPGNKTQAYVLSLADRLPALTEAHSDQMKREMPHQVFYTLNGKCKCSDCGYEYIVMPSTTRYWRDSLNNALGLEGDQCPVCGATLIPKYQRGNMLSFERRTMSVMQVCESWQVMRYLKMTRSVVRGYPTKYECQELYQLWLNDKGKEVILTRPYTRSAFSINFHCYHEWTIGHHNHSYTGSYYYDDMFDGDASSVYSKSEVLPALKRNGWISRYNRISAGLRYLIAKGLLSDPRLEHLAKAGYHHLVIYYAQYGKSLDNYWSQLRIAVRHHYRIKDITMWQDLISFLETNGKDIHSPAYLCPDNLKQAHDRWMSKAEKRRIEEEKRKAAAKNKRYFEAHKQFKGLLLDISGTLKIFPLLTATALVEEGAAMNHCVGTYTNKLKSLILSARDSKNHRLETVEVDLTNYTVIQSRAVNNGVTTFHSAIIQAVTENMNVIKQLNIKQQTK